MSITKIKFRPFKAGAKLDNPDPYFEPVDGELVYGFLVIHHPMNQLRDGKWKVSHVNGIGVPTPAQYAKTKAGCRKWAKMVRAALDADGVTADDTAAHCLESLGRRSHIWALYAAETGRIVEDTPVVQEIDESKPLSKIERLAIDYGYPSVIKLLEAATFDSICPGICTNEGCDYSTDVEGDARANHCECCGTQSVASALVLAEVV